MVVIDYARYFVVVVASHPIDHPKTIDCGGRNWPRFEMSVLASFDLKPALGLRPFLVVPLTTERR
jgi:hypothetical protein